MSSDSPAYQLISDTEEMTKKRKLVKTFWIFWAIMLVGLTNAILGPTVMSLLSITGSPIKSIDLVFLAQGIGFICGILGGTFVSRVMDLNLMLSVSIFVACFTNMALPWMRSLPALLIFVFLQFLLKGVVDYGAMFLCGRVWPRDNHIPFQFISVGVGLGAFVAPFFAYPVLQHPSDKSHGQCVTPYTVRQPGQNSSNQLMPLPICAEVISPNNMIYIPFLVIAVIMLPPGVAFAHYRIKSHLEDENLSSTTYKSLSDSNDTVKSPGVSNRKHWLILMLLMMFFVPFGGVLITYSHLLAAFGVHSGLKMAPSSMALMTSMYWGCFLLGRMLNTLFSTYLTQFVIIICNFLGLFVSNFVLVSFAGHSQAALWSGTAMMSLFNSVFLPGVLTWVGSYTSLQGHAISLSLTGVAIGELVIPYLAGYAFNTFGPMSLMWTILSLCCCELVIFIVLTVLLTRHNQQSTTSDGL